MIIKFKIVDNDLKVTISHNTAHSTYDERGFLSAYISASTATRLGKPTKTSLLWEVLYKKYLIYKALKENSEKTV